MQDIHNHVAKSSINSMLWYNIYISVTLEPEHLIPFHEPSQGSPPLDFQPSSWDGEFILLYMTLRAETAKTIRVIRM